MQSRRPEPCAADDSRSTPRVTEQLSFDHKPHEHAEAQEAIMSNATIRDVAAQARVSIKTVSRVINNVKSVQPETRERVMKVIRKLDYHPNPSARGLGGSRSYLIGVLYDYSCAYYATGVFQGVLEICRAARYQVVLHPCDYQLPTLVDDVMTHVRQSRADGVIITPPLSETTPPGWYSSPWSRYPLPSSLPSW